MLTIVATSGSSGPALGASTTSFTGENTVNSASSAKVTDWQEVITDEEGVEVSSAFEARRQLLDATTVTGEYSGSSSSGSYSSTYEDKTARRVTEVHLGDEDYEYFFKDQVSGASQTLTSTGQPEQKNRARIHNTLEYEILNKGTENEVFREWIEQSYLRGMMIMTPINPDGSGGQQPDDSGRTRVGEYAAGAGGPEGVAEAGWATDPQATPQAVGSGNNPSSTDGPYGGQGGPGEEGEGGGGVVTDTPPLGGKEDDLPIGVVGGVIALPLEPKPGDGEYGRKSAEEGIDAANVIFSLRTPAASYLFATSTVTFSDSAHRRNFKNATPNHSSIKLDYESTSSKIVTR